ncbi:MAG: hypothetical protein M3442_19485 [Chloroflexota bacterium]|nr:hypothetical protein [Chloroflexota bacterium]
MIAKFVETFFRHKWLLMLPPVLMTLAVGAWALLAAPVFFDSVANVWVDRATYLVAGSDGFNSYLTPAQNQALRLNELLRTETFVASVAQRTALAPLTRSAAGWRRLNTAISRGLTVTPSRNNLMAVRFRSGSPQLSQQFVAALLETFREKVVNDRVSQASLATSFYEGRMQTADDQLSKATNEIRRYVAANPRLTTIDPDRGAASTTAARLGLPPIAIDPQLADLIRRVEAAERDVLSASEYLEKARLDVSASLQGQELGFQVVDAPKLPTEPIRELTKRLIYPAGAGFIGLGLSTVLLILLVAADRSVHSETDLAPGLRVAGVVPRLQLKNMPKSAGSDLTRRAIGFAAGAVLPAPSGAK